MPTKRKIEDFEIEHGSLGKSRNDGTDEHSSRLTDVRDVESISTRSRSPVLSQTHILYGREKQLAIAKVYTHSFGIR